ncbi:hypothetical protein AGMMS50230_12600 [Spirochaetia bacterium]|nr:hypothetical protein AGMMS50230_12600 [Spirochaetia bacterium]
MSNWEDIFTLWSKGPDDAERRKIENTEFQIKEAIKVSEKLNRRNIKVFVQGSYRNNVNVRQDSDIDIGVLCYDTFFPEYQDDNIKSHFSRLQESATYTYSTFKNELGDALVSRFGNTNVKRGKKAFNIKENRYRIEADVCTFFEHRRYASTEKYLSGVEMIPDDNNPPNIINWPEQHYENGVSKNTITSRRYKRVVRIMKKLTYELQPNYDIAKKIPSFLMECLIWNVPNKYFSYETYYQTIREIIIFLYNNTKEDKDCSEWGEVSELKYLFRPSQPWSRQLVNEYLLIAWKYIGYK